MLIFYLVIVPLIVPLGAALFCWLATALRSYSAKINRNPLISPIMSKAMRWARAVGSNRALIGVIKFIELIP